MKKILFSALLAGFLGSVQAQTTPVTVYGLLDTGIIVANRVGSSNQSSTFVSSGALYTSRWGIKGAEDLGGGNTSGFVLEGALALNNGSSTYSSSTGATNNLFTRHAKVFLSNNNFGTITIGRQFNSVYEAWLKADTRVAQNFGTGQTYWGDGSAFGGTSTSKTGISSFTGANNWDNAVRYETPKLGGLQVTAQYVPGGVAGDSTASSRYALSGIYTIGPVELIAGGIKINNSSGAETSRVHVFGSTYTFNSNKLAGYYVTMKNPSIPGAVNSDFTLYSVSGKRSLTPTINATVGYYNFKDNITTANTSKLYSAGLDYNISKRTTLYTAVSQVNNTGGFGFSPYGGIGGNLNSLANSATTPAVVTVAGQKQLATTVGIVHRF